MLDKTSIARVKMAQRDSGLDDAAYRALLLDQAGVASCKDLAPDQVEAVIESIKAAAGGGERKGWSMRQIQTFRRYARLAGLDTPKAWRVWLMEQRHITSEQSPYLGQSDFDQAMADLERLIEDNLSSSKLKNPTYWRDKLPAPGRLSSRERHLIDSLWSELVGYLPEEHRSEAYLIGIAAQASRKHLDSLDKLKALDALKVIEALKHKLNHEQASLSASVPF
jgi:hypothetical protein